MPPRLAPLLFALLLCTSAGVRVADTLGKRDITYDESISYLAATCHQAEYDRRDTPPYGAWAPASAWKRFVSVEEVGCFGRIQADLAATDIHPPLYFWLLHVVAVLFGVTPAVGPALNVALHLVGMGLLLRIAQRVTGNPLAGAAVAATWAFSPGALAATAMARPYELLAVLGLAAAEALFALADPRPRRWPAFALGGVLLTGLLTHYQALFLLVAAGLGAAVLAVRAAPDARRRIATHAGLPLLLAPLAAGLAHPGVLAQIHRAGEQRQPASWAAVPDRLEAVASTFANALHVPSPALGAAFAAAALLGCALVVRGAPAAPAEPGSAAPVATRVVLAFLAAIGGLALLQYLSFQSPEHAMGGRYLAAVWPWFAFVPALLVSRLPTPVLRRAGLAILLGASVVSGIVHATRDRSDAGPWRLDRFPALVFDEPKRGILPPMVFHLADDRLVFAAEPSLLLTRDDVWADAVARHGQVVWVSWNHGDRARRAALAALHARLSERYRVTRVKGAWQTAWRIEPG